MLRFSVITPTWGEERHEVLLERCIPSVQRQQANGHRLAVQHLVISDGPDAALRAKLAGLPNLAYLELPEHEEHRANFGQRARNLGLAYAMGEYVAYLDSDNAYRPEHLANLGQALLTGVDFAFSQMVRHPAGDVIGSDPPEYGRIDTSLLAHPKQALERYQGWPSNEEMLRGRDYHAPDWEFIKRWVQRGATWRFVPQVTVDYYS